MKKPRFLPLCWLRWLPGSRLARPRRSLLFPQALEEAALSGRSIICKRIIHRLNTPPTYICLYVTWFDRCIFSCWCLSWMMSRDKLSLLYTRLMSASLWTAKWFFGAALLGPWWERCDTGGSIRIWWRPLPSLFRAPFISRGSEIRRFQNAAVAARIRRPPPVEMRHCSW